MRIGVVSDVHSNLDALQAVLDDMGPVDQVWCLGDIVGYGPEPNECVGVLAGLPHLAVAGNHDSAAIGRIGTDDFNPYAAAAARWTMDELSAETRAYLSQLPLIATSGEFTLAHGSPRDPTWEYVLSASAADANFGYFESRFCFVGHTHVPSVFSQTADGNVLARQIFGDDELDLGQSGSRVILNPGSVGQPRDGDPRAAYLLWDPETLAVSWRRVAYDLERTQALIRAASLPSVLWQRLSFGR